MRGFPMWFNTRADVEYCLTAYPDEMKAKLREWIDNRFVWVTTEEMLSPESAITDATHRVIEESPEHGGAEKYLQQELQEDSNCTLFRLGLSVKAAEEMANRP